MREIVNWLSDEELGSIYTAAYWNNIEEEKKKAWWIEDGSYKKCLDYLDSSKLLYEYQQSEKYIKEYSSESIRVVYDTPHNLDHELRYNPSLIKRGVRHGFNKKKAYHSNEGQSSDRGY